MSEETTGGGANLATREAVFAQANDNYAAFFWSGVGNVRVYSMTVGEREKFDRETRRRKKKTPDAVRVRERLLIATVRDAAGNPMFTATDEEKLSSLPSNKIEKIFTAACRENGYLDEADELDEGN